MTRALYDFLVRGSSWPQAARNRFLAGLVASVVCSSLCLVELTKKDNAAQRRKMDAVNRELQRHSAAIRLS